MAAAHNDGRVWMAGEKATTVSFFSIRPYYKYEDNVASISITPANVRADLTRRPDMTTLWKLQTALKKASFFERGNAGL